MFRITTVAGLFQIDEQGGFLGFEAHESIEEAVENISSVERGYEFSSVGYKLFYENQAELVKLAGLSMDEYWEESRETAIRLAERALSTPIDEEGIVIESIEALGDLNRAVDLFVSRLAVMCPELGVEPDSEGEEMEPDRVLEACEGMQSKLVLGFAHQLRALLDYKGSLEEDVESLMQRVAPNIAGLAGPLLGAKLISTAGGLTGLGRMPGSRIQILGAGRAVFRHLRKRGKPPKHGLIFQHPVISRSPWWQRGKIARSFASKLAIAARLDAYAGDDRSEELQKQFNYRLEAIKRSHPKEPKKLRIIKTPRKAKKRRRR